MSLARRKITQSGPPLNKGKLALTPSKSCKNYDELLRFVECAIPYNRPSESFSAQSKGKRRRLHTIQWKEKVLNRGVARIFPWGGPKYRFQNFGKCNLGEYPLPHGDAGVGTFPNYLNGYVQPNKVVTLERFRLLRNSVCRLPSRPLFYCGTSG